MPHKNHWSIILTSIFLITLFPLTSAEIDNIPTTYNISGMVEAVDEFSIHAAPNDRIGIAFTGTSGKTGFAVGNTTVGWEVKTLDVNASLATSEKPFLVSYGPGNWALWIDAPGTVSQLLFSTDDGENWVWQFDCAGTHYGASSPSDDVLHVVCTIDASDQVFHTKTLDGGGNWAAFNPIGDTDGAPFADSLSPIFTQGFRGIGIIATELSPSLTTVDVLIGGATSATAGCMMQVRSTDGGNFWGAPPIGNSCAAANDDYIVSSRCGSDFEEFSMRGDRTSGFIAAWEETETTQTCTSPTGLFHRVYEVRYTGTTTSTSALSEQLSGSMAAEGGSAVARNSNSQASKVAAGDFEYTEAPGETALTGLLDTVSVDEIGVAMNNQQVFVVYRNTGTGGQTDIVVFDLTPPGSSGGFDSVTVTNLVGYSMDSTGRNIIVRVDSGATIETYSALDISAGPTGSASTATCVSIDGVLTADLAGTIYTVYVDCDGSGDADTLNIKGSSLGAATFDCSEAQGTIDGSDFSILDTFSLPTDLRNIGVLSETGFDYRRCTTSGTNHGAGAITFSDFNGFVGIYTWIFNNLGTNHDDVDAIELDTSVNPDIAAFCSYRNRNDNQDYFAAVTPNGPTGAFLGSVSISGVGDEDVIAEVDQVFLNSGTYSHAKGIGCGDSNMALLLNTKVVFLANATIAGGTVEKLWEQTVSTSATRGLAMSLDGRFVAVVDGSTIRILHANNGTVTHTLTRPSGTFKGIEFDSQAEKLAVFTSSSITIFDTSDFTCGLFGDCGNPITNDGTMPGESGPSSEPCTAIFCPPSEGVGGISASALSLFLGIVIVASFAASMSQKTGSGAAGIAIFALLGLFVAYALGYIQLWVIVSLTVMGVAAIFLGIRNGSQGAGM